MDNFFKKTHCDKCGKKLTARTMSMFNTDCICPECKIKETKLPEYPIAVEAENQAIKNGIKNFEGIGLPNKENEND